MNIRDLEYLIAVAEAGHFGKAAETCFVSQPALSMQIKKLEDFLRVKLFERTSKSVQLTDIGISIVEKAREVLKHTSELRELAQSATDPYTGEIRIGIFPTLAPYLFPHVVSHLSKQLPNVFFHLIEEKSELLLEKLKQGSIHAVIHGEPLQLPGYTEKFLFEEEFLLATPHNHPLVLRDSVCSRDLEEHQLLLLDDGHCMRNQVMDFCHRTGVSKNQRFRVSSLEALRHMISSGAGISLMPKLSSLGCDLATFIPFASPKPTRSINLIYRTTTTKLLLLIKIENEIKSIVKSKKLL
jgi:LysR family hydrogen peroxide-inducible transcriptional activator